MPGLMRYVTMPTSIPTMCLMLVATTMLIPMTVSSSSTAIMIVRVIATAMWVLDWSMTLNIVGTRARDIFIYVNKEASTLPLGRKFKR